MECRKGSDAFGIRYFQSSVTRRCQEFVFRFPERIVLFIYTLKLYVLFIVLYVFNCAFQRKKNITIINRKCYLNQSFFFVFLFCDE